jgi:Outer membrane lipoprotein-sorting protein
MKTHSLSTWIACAALLLSQAVSHAASETTTASPDSLSILAATDRVRGGGVPGVQWDLKIITSDPDTDSGGTERKLQVRAAADNSVAETTYPPRAAGARLLQLGRNMWYGRPDLQRAISISSRQKMMGPAANGDIASTNYSKDYDARLLREEDVKGEPAYVLDLIGKSKFCTYDRIVYWVSKARLVPLKAEFYTVSGKVLKTAKFETANTILVDGQKQPFVSRMVIQDAINSDSVSVLEYSNIRVRPFGPDVFSVASLTR